MSDRVGSLLLTMIAHWDCKPSADAGDVERSRWWQAWNELVSAARAHILNEKPADHRHTEVGYEFGGRGAYASPPHAEPEKPAAWMATNSRSKDMKWLFTDEATALDAADSMTGGTVTPLYAAVQQPIAREPRSCQCTHDPTPDEEMWRVCRKCGKPIIV